MKKILLLTLAFFSAFSVYSQCMEVDISIDRECTDGLGVITVLTGDPDSVTYSIDGGGTFVNTPQFDSLNIGVYNIIVKDTTGCQLTFTEEIQAFLEVGSLSVTTSCGVPSGEIVIEGNLGLPLYQYSFDGGQSFFTDSNKSEIGAGTYNVVIKDSYGCEVDTAVTVDAYPTISPTITTTNEQCNGTGPGMVDVVFSDGANYNFSLDGGASSGGTAYNNSTLLSGFYVLSVTDQYGCTSPFQFEVGADIVDDSVNINNELCHYQNAAIEVFGFLGVAPYEYSIDNGTTYLPSGVFNGLSQGNYVVLIKDGTGCIKEDSIYVTNFGGVEATPSNDDTLCMGNSTIVSVSHNGGVNSQYLWNNGLSNTQSHTVSPTSNTVYSVVVTDGYGCKDTVETTIYVESFPVVSLSDNQLQACIGDNIQLTAYGATRYEWSTGSVTDTIDYVAIGNETITVTGYNGQCSNQDQLVIIIKPSPTATASSDVTSINTGDFINFSNNGSVTSTTNWDFGDGFNSMMSNPSHQFDFPGAYIVVLTSEMGGCEASDSILVYVGTVSIDENIEMNVLVYPNPAKSIFNIKVENKADVSIIDMKGTQVHSGSLNPGNNEISIDKLAKGLYLVYISSNNQNVTLKLVVD